MKLDKRKREVQLEAGKAWIDSGYKGTIELNTGGGKTFISFDAMVDLPKGSTVLFLAETNQREKDIIDDAEIYLRFFGINPLEHVSFEFACYQSAYKWKDRHYDFVVLDEAHDQMSPEYFKFHENNTYDKVMGLSATVRSERVYIIDGIEVSKMDMLNKIAPVCFSYGIADAQREGTGRKLDIHIIYHKLEDTEKTVLGGTKKKPFMTTEKRHYRYLDDSFWSAVYSKRDFMVKSAMSRRSNFLYSLQSKVKEVKKLRRCLKGKTIIFNNDLDTLELITDNVVRSTKKGRTAKEQDHINKVLREKFDKGDIRIIGSFKMLQQGANLKGADNLIIMSMYSSMTPLVQRIGRLRKNKEKVGNVFVFITLDTQETRWWEKATKDIPMEEFNVIEHQGVDDYIKYLK